MNRAEPVARGRPEAERHERYSERTGLLFRNGFLPSDHVPSDLVLEGGDTSPPTVTIAIPTFRRFELLVEAITSAIAQVNAPPFEIIIVDNDPESRVWERVRDSLPSLPQLRLKYFVNRENIRWVGNYNRCITLARGRWVAILNDDDILEPKFLASLWPSLIADDAPDAITCRKDWQYDLKHLEPPPPSALRKKASAALKESQFLGKRTRRIPAHKFIWGTILGNVVGLVFSRDKAIELGGFYAEDGQSDSVFMTRLAAAGELRQHRETLVRIRIAENATLHPDEISKLLDRDHRLGLSLTQTGPARLLRPLLPMITSRFLAEVHRGLKTPLSRKRLSEQLGWQVPVDRPVLFRLLRFAAGGF